MVVNSEVRTSASRSSCILGAQGNFPPIAPQDTPEHRTDEVFRRLVGVVGQIARAQTEEEFAERVASGLPDFAAALRLLLSQRANGGSSVDLRSVRIEQLARIEANWGPSLRHEMQHDIDVRLAAIRIAESLNNNPCPDDHKEDEQRDAEQFASAALIAALMAEVIDISVDMDGANLAAVQRASLWHRETSTAMYVAAMTAYERRYGIADDDEEDDLAATA